MKIDWGRPLKTREGCHVVSLGIHTKDRRLQDIAIQGPTGWRFSIVNAETGASLLWNESDVVNTPQRRTIRALVTISRRGKIEARKEIRIDYAVGEGL